MILTVRIALIRGFISRNIPIFIARIKPSDIASYWAGKVVRQTNGSAQAGFDLTGFKKGGFQRVLKVAKIDAQSGSLVSNPSAHWLWEGDGITVITGNNPVTGKYKTPESRGVEKDYASGMSVFGDAAKVKKVIRSIFMNADFIKEFTPNSMKFI